ncbi:hypothetical protein DALLNEIH_00561 [Bacillus sp. B01(2024)]|nr:hypothetical protein [Bacillus siamensis]OAZ58989.1 uncharacterized protein SRCM100169_03481 [Bacillus siamensis]
MKNGGLREAPAAHGGKKMNIGDVIFQLISFAAAAVFLFAVIYVFRSLNKRRIQLDRIEKKLDALREEKNEKV